MMLPIFYKTIKNKMIKINRIQLKPEFMKMFFLARDIRSTFISKIYFDTFKRIAPFLHIFLKVNLNIYRVLYTNIFSSSIIIDKTIDKKFNMSIKNCLYESEFGLNYNVYKSIISAANKIKTMSNTRNRLILARSDFKSNWIDHSLPKYLTEKSGGDKSFVALVHFSLSSDALPRLYQAIVDKL